MINTPLAKGQWSAEKAWEWYNSHPWIRGYNGYPSNCANRIAMWQKHNHSEVFEQIEREFALAKETGFNAVRAIIQFEVWFFEHDSFMAHLEEYLTLADKHGIKVMLTVGNDCCAPKWRYRYSYDYFGEQKVDWGYHSGTKIGPHTGDYREPGYQMIDEPEYEEKYYEMIREIALKYKNDSRLLIWDVWNEPGNSNRGMMSAKYMQKFFEILRECEVSQPLTADCYSYQGKDGEVCREIERLALDLSDVITFHSYKPYETMIVLIEKLREEYGRPLINNEWLNRYEDNNVKELFPLFYLERIGSFNWGLIQGYSQTYEPWGHYYEKALKDPTFDITKWMHDLYRFNGYPYDVNEINLIKRFCALADKKFEEAKNN